MIRFPYIRALNGRVQQLLALSLIGISLFLTWQIVKASLWIQPRATAVMGAAAPPPQTMELDRLAMVKALEGKLQMTTFSMRLEKYVTGGTCGGNWWQQFAYTDCAALLVPAKVNAGFDWNAFSAQRISATHERVTVDIGAPVIQDVVFDLAKVKVLSHEEGHFSASDKSLHERMLAQAGIALRRDACANGILQAAGLSGQERVGSLLRTLFAGAGDHREVKIVYHLPNC